jgi:signal peptidase II
MWRRIVGLASAVVLVDQLTKAWISRTVGEPIVVVGNFVRIVPTLNPYAIFGLRYKVPLIPLTVIAICVIIFLLFKSKSIQLSIVLGGAIGNLIDRIRLGAVIDWIEIGIHNLKWPVFNVADAAITIGVVWLIIGEWRKDKAEKLNIEH